MKNTERKINEHVADYIRYRRTQLDMTQKSISKRAGVSIQQYQKYESGRNRLSAGRLYILAGALDVPVSYFFDYLEGLEEPEQIETRKGPKPADLQRLLHDFHAIKSERIRSSVLSLLQLLSQN